jgi:4-aminobutyrate aminotransferase-like enzyme
VEIEPAYLEVEIVQGPDGFPVAVPKEPVETLTTEKVREILDEIRAGRGRV